MTVERRVAKKIIIVYVLNILRHTSVSAPVNQTLICDYLNEIGVACDRKTIGRNIKYLKDMGYPIKRTINHGVYMDAELLRNAKHPFLE